jgi:phosphoadenosine phosphosulfate reductase
MKKGSVGDNRVTSTRMSAEEVLRYFLMLFSSLQDAGSDGDQKDRIAVLSSLGAEDQVLTDIILSIKPDARIVVLDTGTFRPETPELMAATMKKYGLLYEVLSPVATEKEEMERDYGPSLPCKNAENKGRCCDVRKLRRLLPTLEAWITGLRAQQAVEPGSVERVEWDEENGLVRVNPLADWSEEDVWEYISAHDVPYEKRHDG